MNLLSSKLGECADCGTTFVATYKCDRCGRRVCHLCVTTCSYCWRDYCSLCQFRHTETDHECPRRAH
jgi:hypothetical protein